jgi:hypothetical protein
VSLVFGFFGSIRGPMKKRHAVDRTVTWKDDVAANMVSDCVGGWHGPMVVSHMAQSWVATWQWENAQ